MTEPSEDDIILASAARFLIDGGEEDAASVLLSCSLEFWPSGDTTIASSVVRRVRARGKAPDMLGVVIEKAYNTFMLELSRFFGIIIRRYAEANISHHSPHFHAYYQEHVAIYTIDPVELIAGALPRRQHRLVEAWQSCTKRNSWRIGNGYRKAANRNLLSP